MKILISLLMAVMFLGGQAVAEEGDICDGQVGAAFGLCKAYIAMGCHTPTPDATDDACAKVMDRFVKITGTNPPWAAVCPLWTQADLEVYYGLCGINVNDDHEYGCEEGSCNTEDARSGPYGRYCMLSVSAATDGSNYSGEVIDVNDDGDLVRSDYSQITEAEHAACIQDILTHEFSVCTDCPLWTTEDLTETYGSPTPCDTCEDDTEGTYEEDGLTFTNIKDVCEGPLVRSVILRVTRRPDGTFNGYQRDLDEDGNLIHEVYRHPLTEAEAIMCEIDIVQNTLCP